MHNSPKKCHHRLLPLPSAHVYSVTCVFLEEAVRSLFGGFTHNTLLACCLVNVGRNQQAALCVSFRTRLAGGPRAPPSPPPRRSDSPSPSPARRRGRGCSSRETGDGNCTQQPRDAAAIHGSCQRRDRPPAPARLTPRAL